MRAWSGHHRGGLWRALSRWPLVTSPQRASSTGASLDGKPSDAATSAGAQPSTSTSSPSQTPLTMEPCGDNEAMASAALRNVTVERLLNAPIDFRKLGIVDKDTYEASYALQDLLTVVWLCPRRQLQPLVYKRYDVDVVGRCNETGEELGLLVMACARRIPEVTGNWITRRYLCEPHCCVGFSAIVADRQHWRRTLWHFGGYNPSLVYGWLPRYAHGISSLNTHRAVDITADLNNTSLQAQGGTELSGPYKCTVSGLLTVEARESPAQLLDRHTTRVPFFTDNESALAVISMPHESLSYGQGNSVVRQPLWSPLHNPQLARDVRVTVNDDPAVADELAHLIGGPLPLDRPPIAAWLQDTLLDNLVFLAEGDIDIEHEVQEHALATAAHQMAGARIGEKTLMRREAFKDRVRRSAYGAAADGHVPR